MSATGRTKMPRRGTPEWKLWEKFLRRHGEDVNATAPTKRRKDDDYPTPEWATQALLRNVPLPRDGWWVEPCAGDGAIIRAAAQMMVLPEVGWIAIEKDGRRARKLRSINNLGGVSAATYRGDFSTATRPLVGVHDSITLVITNPPFLLAQEVAEWALSLPSKPVVALLLRDGFAGSGKRKEFWAKHPADRFTLSTRPAFVDGHTDACDYAWFVWWNGHQFPEMVSPLIGRWGRLERGGTI